MSGIVQEFLWAFEDMPKPLRISALERLRKEFPHEWLLGSMTPAERRFYQAGPRETKER